ncbi:MAG: hypothetical protein J4224_00915 [Candidatus Diapherotrites archaeon]|uniref:Uncharacterized protein n=1 Tax=Candidatus Iainarchaeum sp. TaxID=3101447 RepID=A0A7J4IWV4_9ARCH|nr:MAG: hypothetical protein QT03_C0001G0490 [archaeon GW2011_AR10]MBS3058970.1 hypothetical protein [Candidatus Diapherotrites archaeon]HIH08745.1 hypothetical protein [Candidatus Diapherotrites archaeon]
MKRKYPGLFRGCLDISGKGEVRGNGLFHMRTNDLRASQVITGWKTNARLYWNLGGRILRARIEPGYYTYHEDRKAHIRKLIEETFQIAKERGIKTVFFDGIELGPKQLEGLGLELIGRKKIEGETGIFAHIIHTGEHFGQRSHKAEIVLYYYKKGL